MIVFEALKYFVAYDVLPEQDLAAPKSMLEGSVFSLYASVVFYYRFFLIGCGVTSLKIFPTPRITACLSVTFFVRFSLLTYDTLSVRLILLSGVLTLERVGLNCFA